MEQYKGTITTTGSSEAIRLDKHLFKSHPEFSQKASVIAKVIGRGVILISLAEDSLPEQEEDPLMSTFLSFLENDIFTNPQRIIPITEREISLMEKLTNNVVVTDDEELPEGML
jgi:antitoxin PrlF